MSKCNSSEMQGRNSPLRRGLSRLRLKKIPAKWKRKERTGTIVIRKEYFRPTLFVPSTIDVSDLVDKYFRARRDGHRIIFELVE